MYVIVDYIVGVDGGASKTVALIATEDGKIVGRGRSGSSNYHNVGSTSAGEAIRAAVHQALSKAHLTWKELAVAVVALAGIDSSRDVKEARRFVRLANISMQSFVAHDSVSALYAATRGGPGIIVNSGTGSFAAGINKHGQYARAGGWGYIIGDEGSAFDIGRMALAASFRMLDGRVKPTALRNALRKYFHVNTLEDAMFIVYRSKIDDVARLSPIVSRLAPSDETCRRVLEAAGFELAGLACAVARRLKMMQDTFPVLATGGGFKSGPYLVRPFSKTIHTECPRARISILRTEPVRGALMLAFCKLQEQKRVKVKDFVIVRDVLHLA